MQNLEGKTAVITGAASGVGRVLALRLAKAGVNVVLADIEAGALDKAVAEVSALGVRAIGHVTDVVSREAVDGLRDRAFDEFGKVHMVFNNAGVGGGSGPTVWDTPEKGYRWAMDVNFFGPLNGLLSFMPRLIAQDEEALISATSSAVGLIFQPTGAPYSVSKAALVALMEITAFQLQMAGSKIKASILFPGPHVVDTNLFGSHRNVQPEYADPAVLEGGGINNITQFQHMMKYFIGREVEITKPEDFVEEAYESILKDEFYVLPLTEKAKFAIRKRYEDMLDRRQPSIPDIL